MARTDNHLRYIVYHSQQKGFQHPRDAKFFSFSPSRPFRPLGLIIFGGNDGLVRSVKVGNNEQILEVGPASSFSPGKITLQELESWQYPIDLQYELSSRGIPRIEFETVNIGTLLTVQLSKPVQIVAFWGIEIIR